MQITDRTKDLIKSGGEWISSVALESALMAHPQVKEATVIAIPHEKWIERPLACVVFAEGASVPDDELRRFLSPTSPSTNCPTCSYPFGNPQNERRQIRQKSRPQPLRGGETGKIKE
jgi:acyl-CoA synthetase (AMP-forming)/AMP-acid ligase II